MAYANGQIPAAERTRLATAPGQQLVGAAARQWDALARSVQNTYGWMPVLTDSYRPYEVQERIFRERYRVQSGSGPYGDVRYWQGQRWVRVTGAAAAVPGTSNHGWGKAVDCSGLGGFSGTRFKQLASLAARFGFSNTEGRSVGEAWHWVFTGSYQTSNPVGGGSSVTIPNTPGAPAPITPEDDLTPEQAKKLDQIWWLLGADGALNTKTENTVAYLVRQMGPRVKDVQDALTRDLPAIKQAVAGVKADSWDVRLALTSALPVLMTKPDGKFDVEATAAALRDTLDKSLRRTLADALLKD